MSESELSPVDELVEMEERTNEDGTVTVTIEDWEKIPRENQNDKVRVEFELIDSVEEDRMDWPKPGHEMEKYRFYNIVKSCGLSMRNADLLSGSETRARFAGGDWHLDPPEIDTTPELTTSEKVAKKGREFTNKLRSVDWWQKIILALWTVCILTIIWTAVVGAS